MNLIDRIGGMFSPQWAFNRQVARMHLERLYDAAKTHHQHKPVVDGRRSADGAMEHARDKVTVWARHLDENHDRVTGLLTILANTCSRVSIEPMVRLRGGAMASVMNDRLADKWMQWRDKADSTQSLPWTDLAHVAARTWLRDGELFVNHLEGRGDGIPYQVELLEPDFCPWDLTQKAPPIVHGIEKNMQTGQPTAVYFYDTHPGNTHLPTGIATLQNTRRVPIERLSHVKFVRRLHQTRGISILHPVVHRLDDIGESESSERIAARVAASLCAAIIRQPGFQTVAVNATSGERPYEMSAGQIFELLPGESVANIGSDRPNTELMEFLRSQIRAVAIGTGTRYSRISKDYSDGSYSSQRQELVEGMQDDMSYCDSFSAQFYRPIWERFVRACLLSGQVSTEGINPETLFSVKFVGHGIPWIDPQKEVAANQAAVMAGFKSRQQVIREHGGSVREVDRERAQDTQPGQTMELLSNDESDESDSDQESGSGPREQNGTDND